MRSPSCLALGLILLSVAGAGRSQTTPVLASQAAASAATPAASAAANPNQRTVIEDDKVRIEETRQRGQLQRITVHSKIAGVRDYEIIVGPRGKDPSQDRGAAGQRAWSLFDF